MFAIEALKARHGDCLLLRWSDKAGERVALIDGGPDTTYVQALRPRLEQLAGARADRVLPLEFMMVSHIDDDHINGLLRLTDDLEGGNKYVSIERIWFNSLEGLLEDKLPGNSADIATASVHASAQLKKGIGNPWQAKVLASVPQGQHLHAYAKRARLHETMNMPYQPLVTSGLKPERAKFHGLSLVPIAPSPAAIDRLRAVWREKRKEGITAAYSDDSPYNLSSIVVIAEHGERRMLLTGDALGRDVVAGLEAAGRLEGGKAHFDVLKLPHHGSRNNVVQEFFETVTADHYVVSGDHIRFPNPHEDAMTWLADARGSDDYEVWCTYDLPYMRTIFGKRLRVPGNGDLGVTVEFP